MLNGTETITPLRDRVLVKELPWRNQTATGLHLPDQAQKGEHVWRAVVVAVGPGKPPVALLRRARAVLARAARETGGVATPEDNAEVTDWRVALELDEGLERGFGIDGVKPGDVVLVSKYVHSKFGYGSEELCLVAAADILGIIEGEANSLRQALEGALARLDLVGFGEVA